MKGTGRAAPARIAGLILTAATLLVAALNIYHCVDIFIAGTSPQNIAESGVYIHDVYSREIVAERLGSISWAFVVWLAALIVAVVLTQTSNGSTKHEIKPAKHAPKGKLEMPTVQQTALVPVGRAILCLAAIALIVAGIVNGGMYDVLVKAINICTECIGLG